MTRFLKSPRHLFLRLLGNGALLLLLTLSSSCISAASTPVAPTLSVHESLYGFETRGTQRWSVSRIDIHLLGRMEPERALSVQCFFLKKGQPGESPTIQETVLFEHHGFNATYEVTAKPIKISPVSKPTSKSGKKKTGKKSAKKAKGAATVKPSTLDFPREGYIVRLVGSGIVLRTEASSHTLDRFAKENAPLLDQAACSKSARLLNEATLIKK